MICNPHGRRMPTAHHTHPQNPPPFVVLASGARCDLASPAGAPVTLRDVAEGLAKTPILAGQTPADWCNLAQRACHVADLLAHDAKGYGLLWDGPAAVGLDPSAPWLALLPSALPVVESWRNALFHAAGLPPPPDAIRRAVTAAHARVRATEYRDLFHADAPTLPGVRALPSRLVGWSWGAALDRWHQRLDRAGLIS